MFTESENRAIRKAIRIINSKLTAHPYTVESVEAAKHLAQLKIGAELSEVFSVMFFNTRHQFIDFENLFFGTIDGASVHPREVVKRSLAHNAAAAIFVHNHPSGSTEPSGADKQITRTLADILKVIDVRVLDHIIVSPSEITSFAERGLL